MSEVQRYQIKELRESNNYYCSQIDQNNDKINEIVNKKVVKLYTIDDNHLDQGILELECIMKTERCWNHEGDTTLTFEYWDTFKRRVDIGFVCSDGAGDLFASPQALVDAWLPMYEEDLQSPDIHPLAVPGCKAMIELLKAEQIRLAQDKEQP